MRKSKDTTTFKEEKVLVLTLPQTGTHGDSSEKALVLKIGPRPWWTQSAQ